MAARIGLSQRALSALHPAACSSDLRVVFKEGDELNISLYWPVNQSMVMVNVSSIRELRLLARQFDALADRFESKSDPWSERF